MTRLRTSSATKAISLTVNGRLCFQGTGGGGSGFGYDFVTQTFPGDQHFVVHVGFVLDGSSSVSAQVARFCR